MRISIESRKSLCLTDKYTDVHLLVVRKKRQGMAAAC